MADNDREVSEDSQSESCPVCGEIFNHWIDNGYRNEWPLTAKIAVCTDESTRMFVHVTDPNPSNRV